MYTDTIHCPSKVLVFFGGETQHCKQVNRSYFKISSLSLLEKKREVEEHSHPQGAQTHLHSLSTGCCFFPKTFSECLKQAFICQQPYKTTYKRHQLQNKASELLCLCQDMLLEAASTQQRLSAALTSYLQAPGLAARGFMPLFLPALQQPS